MVRRAGWGGTLRLTGDGARGARGRRLRRSCSCASAGTRRASATRRSRCEFDCIGQETTGPGGFAKALADRAGRARARRADGRDRRAGRLVRRLHEPDRARRRRRCWTRATARCGLCNVAIGFQRELREPFRRRARPRPARSRRSQPPDLGAQGARSTAWTGCPSSSPTRSTGPSTSSRACRSSSSATLGADPELRTCTTTTGPERVLARAARRAQTRAEEVMEIEAGLLELYRDPTLDTKPKLLEERGGAFVLRRSRRARRVAARRHRRRAGRERAERRARSPNLADDDVVEVTCRVDRDGAHPLPIEPLAPEMLGLVAAREGLRAADDRRRRSSGSRERRAQGAAREPARRRRRLARPAARRAPRGEPRATCRGSSRGLT